MLKRHLIHYIILGLFAIPSLSAQPDIEWKKPYEAVKMILPTPLSKRLMVVLW